MHIETERLYIRPFVETDGPGLYAYLSDPNVVWYEPYDVFTEEAAQAEAAARAANPAFGAVCSRETDALIGNTYLSEQAYGAWEIGYVFNARFWGQGYATEAVRALINHAFTVCGARRIVAECNPENTASWRLLERLGLRREGRLRQNIYFKIDHLNQPIWQDTYLYALLRG